MVLMRQVNELKQKPQAEGLEQSVIYRTLLFSFPAANV
jgi:hypothetical protein